MEFTGERVVPWSIGMRGWTHVLQHHLARYTFALGYVSGRRVLDIGSGAGYGAFIMSFIAESVTGIDISAEAVDFARQRFNAAGLEYLCDDVEGALIDAVNFNFGVDAVTCFECLEHLNNPQGVIDMATSAGLVFVWSVPVNDPGRFHRHVYTEAAARELVPGSRIFYQSDAGLIVPENEATFAPKYIVGVHGG
jgi:O-antigen biosynthesis protein